MMECIIQRNRLLEALQPVVGVVEARQASPILSHVLLEVSSDTMTMQCTDNEMSIITRASLKEVLGLGKTTVSAYTLLEIVRRLPSDADIKLKNETNQVLVESGSSHFRLASLSSEDFPSAMIPLDMHTVSMSEKLLYEAIKTTHFSMAQNNPRYYLNGMLWHITGNQFQVVATDAHRLAKRSITIESTKDVSMIVPRKTVLELSKLLKDGNDAQINIGFTDNQLCIKTNHYQLTSRLIAGSFPDYKKLLPASDEHQAVIDRDPLKEALSKLMPLLKQEIHKGVKLDFTHNFLKLRVANAKQETGEESLSVRYQARDDIAFSIAFNIEYLDKVLDVLPSGPVKLILPKPAGVTLLQQYQENNEQNHLYLIMPILL